MYTIVLAMMLAAGPETETREFRVSVDGRPAGVYTMTLTKHADGTIVQSGQVDVTVQVLIKKFTYNYRGSEIWKDGKLLKLESSTNEDGKRYNVRIDAEATGLRVTANSKTASVPATAWTTSHWHLPADRRIGDITRIDNDTGRVLTGRIARVGQEQVLAGGQMTLANHYRITGASPAELWFDGAERLIRQESVEDGHRTLIELVRIAR